ncbi:MAG: right-handed parallel beta-helix repeat-containing protein [Gemmatimonadota bacterium]|nr:MAG: right-handed parallel beta-helix repeat-containing protein [Gemmatimonadota bacterium]
MAHARPPAALLALLAAAATGRPVIAQEPPLPEVELRPGLVITTSVRVRPGTYRLAAPASLDSALIVVRGDDITVDFAGARLEGMPAESPPDTAVGVALRIDGGRTVRIENAHIRGYRFAIVARGTHGLALVDNDLSYTWKPRLFSLVEHESLLDWLSYHHNDDGEWLRFGAAIYLDGVRGGTIAGNRAVQGMNGLLATRSDSLRIVGNEFAFNSGLGIGLYRSSDNSIMHNRLDYNVRGYSHGFYRRGQDSAALLLYEQSQRNVIAYNSATHSGDGLFIWAGQTTMDSGTGGVNDNLVFGNDFSYAPTNGMEATFSRNTFVANRSVGSTYGLWGGYSYESRIVGNCFGGNRFGIAVEHGQDNLIAHNRFDGDSTAVQLWANPSEPTDWGYPQHRDTRSRAHRVEHNVFNGNRVGIRGTRTRGLRVAANTFAGVDSLTVLTDTAAYVAIDNVVEPALLGVPADVEPCQLSLPEDAARLAPPPLGHSAEAPRSPLTGRDRAAMIVDAWGPYDWRSPKLWPVDSTRAVPLALAVLGPPGTWRIVERRGLARVSAATGTPGDTIMVTPEPGAAADWSLTLEYRGAATVSPRGVVRPAGEPYRFGYARFEPAQAWTARIHLWSDSTHPVDQPEAFARLLGSAPHVTYELPRLDWQWYRPTVEGLPRERWAMHATSEIELAPGTYTLRTISDDAIRVWVDDALVIDHWEPHGSEIASASLKGGHHTLRVEYYQDGGWTELRLEILAPVRR